MSENNKELFYHVGLGKTGTTFLQYKVFPKFKGVHYIQRTKYEKSIQLIQKTNYPRYFVSNEFDRQFAIKVPEFAKSFPQARVIIVLRRHDSWIASQYRRYVKNGCAKTFQEFIDLDHDKGIWLQKDLYFYPKLQMIDDLFYHKPLVLFYDHLREDPMGFIEKIAQYMKVTYNPKVISTSRKHKSYSDKQLKVRRWMNRYFTGTVKTSKNRTIKRLQRFFFIMPVRYSVLYSAHLVPNALISDAPLTPPDYLERIRNFYEDDWNKCIDFVQKS